MKIWGESAVLGTQNFSCVWSRKLDCLYSHPSLSLSHQRWDGCRPGQKHWTSREESEVLKSSSAFLNAYFDWVI